MAFESNIITVIGNLTDDPDLRFTGNGVPVCSVRVATNRRWTDREGRDQEETTFVTANVWRELAENVANSLRKGDRAIVIGRLRIRSYQDRDGQTRWVTEIEADEIAPSLRWAIAKPGKTRGPAATAGAGDGDAGTAPPPPDMEDVPF
ncbi:MAG TPA: single-stranded DNA-binding protein [Nitriliruptorales bacterium]|nr:single-stranded DNA-binding protein [Nitriliruptorales bacterium]